MAKRRQSGILNRCAGKRFVFNGKFEYGAEDSLKAIARAQQGTVKDDLDDKVDYLVLADATAGKTIQKKAASLNGKGASIQVIDVDAFKKLAEPTEEEFLALLRAGESATYAIIRGSSYYLPMMQATKTTYYSEDLRDVKLKDLHLAEIAFDGCDFSGAELTDVQFRSAINCDFSKAVSVSINFGDVSSSRFHKATVKQSEFHGSFSGADFTGATLDDCAFSEYGYYQRTKSGAQTGLIFKKATLKSVAFQNVHLGSPDFSGADLIKCELLQCTIDSGNFSGAKLRDAVLMECKLKSADLSNVDLTGANLAGADLSGANLKGANLKNTNLRGTKLDGVDLSKAKNYNPAEIRMGAVGPALKELDSLVAKANRIQISFHLKLSDEKTRDENDGRVGIDSTGLRSGWGVQLPLGITAARNFRGGAAKAFSDAMLQLATISGHQQVRFETLEVSSTKSPKGGAELRDLVMRGISEAYAQELPPAEELAAATKTRRDAQREKGAAERERREKEKVAAAKAQEKTKKQIAKKVEKAVGKVTDVASFLKALEVRIEKPKIDKATKMLKASRFKLFNDVTDQYVSGVVKSQNDPDLFYACRIAEDGQYSCCTQNLNVCGGLRGSICKHQLVLIIGLVQAGELDPTTIDGWIAKTHTTKPELDKEIMGEIFIKYKGAEAGEVDWRPTETVPEDYYAL